MSKPYMQNGKWYRNGKPMSDLDLAVMDSINKNSNGQKKKGLGLNITKVEQKPNNTVAVTKTNITKKPVQKKPRPPGDDRLNELWKDIVRIKKQKKQMKNMFGS